MSNSWRPHGPQPTRLLCPWDSPSKNTEVSCHALFQGILPTQGWNPYLLCLLYCQMDSLLLAPRGKSQSNYTPIKKKKKVGMMAPFTLLLMLLSLSWLEPLMESCWFSFPLSGKQDFQQSLLFTYCRLGGHVTLSGDSIRQEVPIKR